MLEKEFPGEKVLNSEEEGFDKKLFDLCWEMKANVCLEQVAGELTGKIAKAIYMRGKILSVGYLSEKDYIGISPLDIVGRGV